MTYIKATKRTTPEKDMTYITTTKRTSAKKYIPNKDLVYMKGISKSNSNDRPIQTTNFPITTYRVPPHLPFFCSELVILHNSWRFAKCNL